MRKFISTPHRWLLPRLYDTVDVQHDGFLMWMFKCESISNSDSLYCHHFHCTTFHDIWASFSFSYEGINDIVVIIVIITLEFVRVIIALLPIIVFSTIFFRLSTSIKTSKQLETFSLYYDDFISNIRPNNKTSTYIRMHVRPSRLVSPDEVVTVHTDFSLSSPRNGLLTTKTNGLTRHFVRLVSIRISKSQFSKRAWEYSFAFTSGTKKTFLKIILLALLRSSDDEKQSVYRKRNN